MPRISTAERFWAKVNKNGPVPPHCPKLGPCWIWTKSRFRFGYGRLMKNGKRVKAHRVAWELTRGPILPGICVLHRCDVPACVNPVHLFLGTKGDNNADTRSKGRENPCEGSEHRMAKLTEADVLEIRRRYAANSRDGALQVLANAFGVSRSLMSRVVRRKIWKHI